MNHGFRPSVVDGRPKPGIGSSTQVEAGAKRGVYAVQAMMYTRKAQLVLEHCLALQLVARRLRARSRLSDFLRVERRFAKISLVQTSLDYT